MISDRNNPLQELSYLKIELGGTDVAPTCLATLDVFPCELECYHNIFSVGFSTVWLFLEPEGFEPVLETRYGLTAFPISTEVEQANAQALTNNRSDEVGGKASVTLPKGPSFDVLTKSTAGQSTQDNRSTNLTRTVQHVRPRGDASWEVMSGDGAAISGNVVPSVQLVALKNIASNRKYISASVVVRQRDMHHKVIEKKGITGKISHHCTPDSITRSKLAAIFKAKCIARRANPEMQYDGKFEISRATLSEDII